jgi:hypothetical protein
MQLDEIHMKVLLSLHDINFGSKDLDTTTNGRDRKNRIRARDLTDERPSVSVVLAKRRFEHAVADRVRNRISESVSRGYPTTSTRGRAADFSSLRGFDYTQAVRASAKAANQEDYRFTSDCPLFG